MCLHLKDIKYVPCYNLVITLTFSYFLLPPPPPSAPPPSYSFPPRSISSLSPSSYVWAELSSGSSHAATPSRLMSSVMITLAPLLFPLPPPPPFAGDSSLPPPSCVWAELTSGSSHSATLCRLMTPVMITPTPLLPPLPNHLLVVEAHPPPPQLICVGSAGIRLQS